MNVNVKERERDKGIKRLFYVELSGVESEERDRKTRKEVLCRYENRESRNVT